MEQVQNKLLPPPLCAVGASCLPSYRLTSKMGDTCIEVSGVVYLISNAMYKKKTVKLLKKRVMRFSLFEVFGMVMFHFLKAANSVTWRISTNSDN